MNLLPIEQDNGILIEYGRAFAWLNLVDTYLETLILRKGKLLQAERRMVEKLLENKTLGAKIFLANDFLDDLLKQDLQILNKNRNTLAHRTISTGVLDNGNGKELKHFLLKNFRSEVVVELNKEFLEKIINSAKNICNRIRQIIIK